MKKTPQEIWKEYLEEHNRIDRKQLFCALLKWDYFGNPVNRYTKERLFEVAGLYSQRLIYNSVFDIFFQECLNNGLYTVRNIYPANARILFEKNKYTKNENIYNFVQSLSLSEYIDEIKINKTSFSISLTHLHKINLPKYRKGIVEEYA